MLKGNFFVENRKKYKVYEAEALRSFCKKVFLKTGLSQENAEIVSDSLIEADLRGVNTHGIMRVPIYVKRLKLGLVNPDPKIRIEKESSSTLLIDGDNGMGQVVGVQVMNLCTQRASTPGVAFVAVKNSNHFGTAAYYSMIASRKDMIGIALSNAPPTMAPYGSRTAYLGTNPFSISIPTAWKFPIVVDMATSKVARANIILAAREGREIPPNWALDSQGRPTKDPKKALNGAVLPMAGAKGYCIALIIDVLCSMLTGTSFGKHINSLYKDFDGAQKLGHFFGAIAIENFVNICEFKARLNQEIEEIKSLPPGNGFTEVLLPGEVEYLTKIERMKKGISLSKEIAKDLQKVAREIGVDTEVF